MEFFVVFDFLVFFFSTVAVIALLIFSSVIMHVDSITSMFFFKLFLSFKNFLKQFHWIFSNIFHIIFTDWTKNFSTELFSTEKRNEMRKTEEINEENSKNNFEIFYFYLLCALFFCFFWISSIFMWMQFLIVLCFFRNFFKFCCWSKLVVVQLFMERNWAPEHIEKCFFYYNYLVKESQKKVLNINQLIIMIKSE